VGRGGEGRAGDRGKVTKGNRRKSEWREGVVL
jgi:hypothetical protein